MCKNFKEMIVFAVPFLLLVLDHVVTGSFCSPIKISVLSHFMWGHIVLCFLFMLFWSCFHSYYALSLIFSNWRQEAVAINVVHSFMIFEAFIIVQAVEPGSYVELRLVMISSNGRTKMKSIFWLMKITLIKPIISSVFSSYMWFYITFKTKKLESTQFKKRQQKII